MLRPTALALLAVAASCGRAPHPPRAPVPPAGPPPPPAAPRIAWTRVASPDDVPRAPPPPGTWRLHLIDVGTGLAILVQGADFALLYDAGSNDRDETPWRVVDYLTAALGPPDDPSCVDPDAPATPAQSSGRRTLDQIVLGHPHFDHASALEQVLACWEVADVWDTGAVPDRVFYRDFLAAVAHEAGATYHTFAPVADARTIHAGDVDVTIPASVAWRTFSEGDVIPLGADARATVLHADARIRRDPNDTSIVLRLDLGATSVLLTGDAGSGKRAPPDAPVGAVEAYLLEHDRAALDVDILQVGHHGSETSSRAAFLAAVSPTLALVSAGPKPYGHVVLPDQVVLDALAAAGATVLRTDLHDGDCPDDARIGADAGPGGCDSWIVTITAP